MDSVDLRLVSVGEVGHVERARLQLVKRSGSPREHVESNALDQDSNQALAQQLGMVRRIAERITKYNEIVRGCTARRIQDHDLHLVVEGMNAFEGGSFGLSLLLGTLGLTLGCPPRPEHIFSAGLPAIESADQAFRVLLQPVYDGARKIAAASIGGYSRIFLACQDTELHRPSSGYAAGSACEPRLLPTLMPVSVSALLALGLDLQPLSERANAGPAACRLFANSLHGLSEIFAPEGIQSCMASTLATARMRSQLNTLTVDGASIEDVIWHAGLACLGSITDEERLCFVLKAMLSLDPKRPVLPGIESERDDLTTFVMRSEADHNSVHAYKLLHALGAASRVAHDASAYESVARSKLEHWLMTRIGAVFHPQFAGIDEEQMDEFLGMLQSEIVLAVRLFPSIAESATRELSDLIRAKPRAAEISTSTAKSLLSLCESIRFDEARKPMLEGLQAGRLSIEFGRITDTSESHESSNVGRFNDLEVAYKVGEYDSVSLRSPVVLVESPNLQTKYCQKNGFTMQDTLLSSISEDTAQSIRDQFAVQFPLNSIGYRFKNHGQVVSVSWPPVTFPPAIDTMHLIATLEEHGSSISPESVIDAGCGTGLLGLAAASLWPSVRRAGFIDVDAYAVRAAQMNAARHLSGQTSVECVFESKDLLTTDPEPVDLLLSNPPYLPGQSIPQAGIQLATNGTAVLESLIRSHAPHAKHSFIVCSALAWPEVNRALKQSMDQFTVRKVVKHEFVPFRISWLEPREGEKSSAAKRAYYEQLLVPRGLIDLDGGFDRYAYKESLESEASRDGPCDMQPGGSVWRTLETLERHSRGFRFWHEIRVLYLESGNP